MNQSGHWTDEEMFAALYGAGPEGDHVASCAECSGRLLGMQSNRESVEQAFEMPVNGALLAAQRRSIYARLERPSHSWRRWAAGVMTACALGASVFLYEHNQEMKLAQERANDAKLIQEVAAMANDTSVSSMAPLEGLFE